MVPIVWQYNFFDDKALADKEINIEGPTVKQMWLVSFMVSGLSMLSRL